MLELITQASAFILRLLPAMARIAAMVAVAPGFSFEQVPVRVRALVSLALALAIAPAAAPSVGQSEAMPQTLLASVAREAAFGTVIGLVACLLVEAARYAGSFVELQAGLRVAQIIDPATSTPSSLLGRLYYFAAVVVFFDLRGHHVLLAGLMRSLQTIPPGHISFPIEISRLAADLVAAGFLLGASLALPALSALLLTDLAFGLVARLVVRFNIFFVSLPAKMAVTLVSLAVSAPVLSHVVARIVAELTWRMSVLSGP